jgi:hypothetical protein
MAARACEWMAKARQRLPATSQQQERCCSEAFYRVKWPMKDMISQSFIQA